MFHPFGMNDKFDYVWTEKHRKATNQINPHGFVTLQDFSVQDWRPLRALRSTQRRWICWGQMSDWLHLHVGVSQKIQKRVPTPKKMQHGDTHVVDPAYDTLSIDDICIWMILNDMYAVYITSNIYIYTYTLHTMVMFRLCCLSPGCQTQPAGRSTGAADLGHSSQGPIRMSCSDEAPMFEMLRPSYCVLVHVCENTKSLGGCQSLAPSLLICVSGKCIKIQGFPTWSVPSMF